LDVVCEGFQRKFLRAGLFGEQGQFKVRKMEKISRAAVSRLVVTMELRLTPVAYREGVWEF
jgi:hypothetical protein